MRAKRDDVAGSRPSRVWLYVVAALVVLFLVIPELIVVPMSFSDSTYLTFPPAHLSLRWYRSYFESPAWMAATGISLRAALLTVMLSLPLGVAAAYGLRASGGRLTAVIRAALFAPVVVPIIIVAIGVFYVYAALGWLNTIGGLVLAHTVLAIPFVFVIVAAGLSQIDMGLEDAAVSLGACRPRAFATVTLPQLQLSLIGAALVAFITSLDEVAVSLFISVGQHATVTRRMFESLRDQVDPTIAAISTLLIVLSVVCVAVFSMIPVRPSG